MLAVRRGRCATTSARRARGARRRRRVPRREPRPAVRAFGRAARRHRRALDFRDGQPRYPTATRSRPTASWKTRRRRGAESRSATSPLFDAARAGWRRRARGAVGRRTIGMTTSAGVDLAFNTSVAPTMTRRRPRPPTLRRSPPSAQRRPDRDARARQRRRPRAPATLCARERLNGVDGSGDVGGADFIPRGRARRFDSHAAAAASPPSTVRPSGVYYGRPRPRSRSGSHARRRPRDARAPRVARGQRRRRHARVAARARRCASSRLCGARQRRPASPTRRARRRSRRRRRARRCSTMRPTSPSTSRAAPTGRRSSGRR